MILTLLFFVLLLLLAIALCLRPARTLFNPFRLVLAGCLALFLCVALSGCNDFERASFKTLSASKAVIDGAATAYEAKTIPQTTAAYNLITKAQDLQKSAVDALQVYDTLVVAKADPDKLQAQQNVVAGLLAQLPALIVDLKALTASTKPVPAGPAPMTYRPYQRSFAFRFA